MSSNNKVCRVLEVLGGLNRGGAETWLMHLIRNIDREQYKIDFLVHTEEICPYDEEARKLGSSIFRCPYTNKPITYMRSLKRILRSHGPYDVVHSHVHHFSGIVLQVAKWAQVPIRISHSHNAIPANKGKDGLLRSLYLRFTETLIQRNATHGLACSAEAGSSLFGKTWGSDKRWRILHCGIDLTPFIKNGLNDKLRYKYGIPENRVVIGHIGRFTPQKNHVFFVAIAKEILRYNPTYLFFFVGDGPLRKEIMELVAFNNLSDNFIFLHDSIEVPSLLREVIDIFLFPSLHEGLPLVLMEAQAAGIPCVISNVIAREADIINSLITRISLEASPINWAQKVVEIAESNPLKKKGDYVDIIKQSSFNITNGIRHMVKLYGGSA